MQAGHSPELFLFLARHSVVSLAQFERIGYLFERDAIWDMFSMAIVCTWNKSYTSKNFHTIVYYMLVKNALFFAGTLLLFHGVMGYYIKF